MVLGVPRAAGCLLCYVAVVLGCLLSLAASVVSGADGLPLVSPASPCAAAFVSAVALRPSRSTLCRNAGGADHDANRTSGLRPSPAVPYGSVGIVPAHYGYVLLASYRY